MTVLAQSAVFGLVAVPFALPADTAPMATAEDAQRERGIAGSERRSFDASLKRLINGIWSSARGWLTLAISAIRHA